MTGLKAFSGGGGGTSLVLLHLHVNKGVLFLMIAFLMNEFHTVYLLYDSVSEKLVGKLVKLVS